MLSKPYFNLEVTLENPRLEMDETLKLMTGKFYVKKNGRVKKRTQERTSCYKSKLRGERVRL